MLHARIHVVWCCFLAGFLAANRIGPLKNDMDVDVTFEGDNTVMMQQVAKGLLEEAKGRRSAPSIPTAAMASGSSQLAACSALLHFRSSTCCQPFPYAALAPGLKGLM